MASLRDDNLSQPLGPYLRREFAALRAGWTVGEALVSLRSGTLAEKIIYLYVIDEGGKLVGVVPTRRLLMSDLHCKIADIMVSQIISIPESMTVLDACEFFVMHRLLAFPVVNGEGRLIGVIDVNLFTDEMFDISQHQSNRDIFQLIGIHMARARRSSPWVGFRDRFPWLLCNLGGGIACAFIAGMYEHSGNVFIILALFIPVVLTLSEGVSMQSMTITIQGLREARAEWKMIFRSLRIELLTAALLGAASGGLVGLIAWAWKRDGAASLAIGLSICLAIITACLLGVMLPALVRLLKGDPRVAAGPVVLASADIATLLFYFGLSGAILG